MVNQTSFEGRIEHWLSFVVKDFSSPCVRVRVDTNYLSKEVEEEIETGHRRQYMRLLVACFFLIKYSHGHSLSRYEGN